MYGLAARVVVVGEGPGRLLHRDVVQTVRVEDAAGNLRACHPVGDGDLEVLGERALDPVLGPEADRHRKHEEEKEVHGVIVAPALPVLTAAPRDSSRS